MNKRKEVALISVVLISIFIVLFGIYVTVNKPVTSSYEVSDFKLWFYGDISDAYQTDKEVIKVYELCLDSEIKAVCVYENINFTWNDSFEEVRKDYFFSPTEMFEYGGYGICRDIAVFRMAVFKKLNIYAEFVFIPKHVYVEVFENGKVYELNNDVLSVREPIIYLN